MLDQKRNQIAIDLLTTYAIIVRYRPIQSSNLLTSYAMLVGPIALARKLNASVKTIEAERAKFFASRGSKPEESREKIIEKLLVAYYSFIDLFLRRAVEELPPHRLGLDYEIKLMLGT